MTGIAKELRWAARRLSRAPGSSLAAVSVLALSIACTLTVVSVARAVLFAALPFEEPDQLVVLERRIGDEVTSFHSPADLIDLRDRCDAFSVLSGSAQFRALLTGPAQPTYVTGASVTPEYLEMLGAKPVLGETFRADAGGRPAEPHVVAVSWNLWRTALGGDQQVLGKTVFLGGESYRVVAVMPEELTFLGVDLWTPGPEGVPRPPFSIGPELLVRRDLAYLTILGRLDRGWSLEAARSVLAAAARRIVEAYPADYPEVEFTLVPLKDSVVAGARDHLAILWACVAVVFVLGCLSVSGLLLGRGIARADHDATKLLLGATRRRVAVAGFAESLLLAAAAGTLGILASGIGIRLFLSLAPPFPRSDQASLDPWLVLVAAGAALFAALLAGLLPVLRTFKVPPGVLVPTTGRAYGTRSRKLSWKLLLALEVACMVVLLLAGLMLGRRLLELNRLDLGFTPEGVLVTLLELPGERYSDPEDLASFSQSLLDRLEALPGTQSVGAALPLPLSGGRIGGTFSIGGRPVEPGAQSPSAWFSVVSHDYFRTLHIRVLEGRSFGPQDRRGSPPVAAVNQTLADRYWHEGNPLGAELILGDGELVRVVAVVQDVRHSLMESTTEPRIYRPFLQHPLPAISIALRTRQTPKNLDSAVRKAVHEIDPAQPVPALTPMEQMLSGSLQPVRYLLLIVGGLAGLAVVITAVGLYALLAFTVREQERELALRLALGDSRSALLRAHVGHGLLIAVAGTIVGALGALVASPLLERAFLMDERVDATLVLVVSILTIVSATLASLIGARRVLRLTPSRALRDV